MKTYKNTLFMAGFLMIMLSSIASAEVPLLINYRGYVDVTDPVIGLPTGALTVDLEFNLYDTSETEGATPLWTETQAAQLLDGNFAVLLGSVNPLNLNLFSGAQRYLTVSIEGNLVIGPQRILSVPYAMQAGNVYSASDGRVGVGTTSPASHLEVVGTVKASHVQTSGNVLAGGSVTAGGVVQSNSGGFKFPDGTTQNTQAIGDGHSLDAADGSPANALSVDNDGQVGIGTTSPEAALHLSSSESVQVLLEADTNDDLIGDASDHPQIRFSQDGGLVNATVGFLDGEDNVLGVMNEYQAVHADLVLGTSDTEHMRVTADGKIGMGTDSPQAELHVAGSAIVEGTVDAGHFRLNGEKPFFLKTIYVPRGGWETETGISTAEYTCIIAGFDALSGDIQENGLGNPIRVFMRQKEGTWRVCADVWTHGTHEYWYVYVLAIKNDLVEIQ